MNDFSIAQRPFGDIVLNRLRRCNKTSFDLAQYLCCEKQHLERALFGEVPLAEVCKLTDLEKYFGTSDGYFIQVFQNCANNAPKYYDKPPMTIKLNLQSGGPIEIVPADEKTIACYEKFVESVQNNLNSPFKHVNHDPEMAGLYARVKELAASKSFTLISPREMNGSNKDQACTDFLVTTYPITGIESLNIIKGREAEATSTGDKYVFSDKLKNTIETLKSDQLVGEYPNVVFGTKRLLALMDDPEFIKVIENATTDKLSGILLKALHNGDKPNNPDNSDDELVSVPKWLLQCLYDIACEHNYPIAADACEILTKHKKGEV